MEVLIIAFLLGYSIYLSRKVDRMDGALHLAAKIIDKMSDEIEVNL